MITIISFFFYTAYIIIAVSYTLEALLNKEVCQKSWYLILFNIIWCILISWVYFPSDLDPKLYKKLS